MVLTPDRPTAEIQPTVSLQRPGSSLQRSKHTFCTAFISISASTDGTGGAHELAVARPTAPLWTATFGQGREKQPPWGRETPEKEASWGVSTSAALCIVGTSGLTVALSATVGGQEGCCWLVTFHRCIYLCVPAASGHLAFAILPWRDTSDSTPRVAKSHCYR